VTLRGVLEPHVVAGARAELDKLVDLHAARLLAAGKISDPLPHEPFETRFYRLYEHDLDEAPTQFRQELHLLGLFDVFFHPRVLDVVESILGGEIRL